jgi:hypothetical protein
MMMMQVDKNEQEAQQSSRKRAASASADDCLMDEEEEAFAGSGGEDSGMESDAAENEDDGRRDARRARAARDRAQRARMGAALETFLESDPDQKEVSYLDHPTDPDLSVRAYLERFALRPLERWLERRNSATLRRLVSDLKPLSAYDPDAQRPDDADFDASAATAENDGDDDGDGWELGSNEGDACVPDAGTHAMLTCATDFVLTYALVYRVSSQEEPNDFAPATLALLEAHTQRYLEETVLPALAGKTGPAMMAEFARRQRHATLLARAHAQQFMFLDRGYVSYERSKTEEKSTVGAKAAASSKDAAAAMATTKFERLEVAELARFRKHVFEPMRQALSDALVESLACTRASGAAVVSDETAATLLECARALDAATPLAECKDMVQRVVDDARAHFAAAVAEWPAAERLERAADAVETECARLATQLPPVIPPRELTEDEREEAYWSIDPYAEPGEEGYVEPNPEPAPLPLPRRVRAALTEDLLLADGERLLVAPECGVRAMLAAGRFEALAKVARALADTPLHARAADLFQAHMLAEAPAETEAAAEGAPPDAARAAAVFLDAVLALHARLAAPLLALLPGDMQFTRAHATAMTELVNRGGVERAPAALAAYVDRLLRGGGEKHQSDERAEEARVTAALGLFAFLRDQDEFAESYRVHMARRLLDRRSASNDMERLAVALMKSRCGAAYTARMEGMLVDATTSATELRADYDRHAAEQSPLQARVDVCVLTASHWPTQPALAGLTLPAAMRAHVDRFAGFYAARFPHRKLEWAHTQGQASVRFRANGGDGFVDLQVGTAQAAVLLALDEAPAATDLAALQRRMGMSEDLLKRAVHSLAFGRYRVLRRCRSAAVAAAAAAAEDGGGGGKESGKIQMTDAFEPNPAFRCEERRPTIPMPQPAPAHDPRRMEEDRSAAIDAAVIRTMKTRQTLGHQALLVEVLGQLAFFKPDPKQIKRRIESLIERDYLERDGTATYKYLA